MIWTRREFLHAALTGAAVLPLAGKGLTTDVFRPRDPLIQRDRALLEELERASFEFFWKESDPRTGLVRDRSLAAGGGTSRKSSIAATGFGLTALCIGAEHGYRPHTEIRDRVRSSLHFLAHEAPHVHGFLFHFSDLHSGHRSNHSEISPIDTAILLCGVLTCREYFRDESIRRDANLLYHRVNWNWALNGGDAFAMAWMPESGFSSLRWDTYCESMMMYLLALGSPTHSIPARCWDSMNRPWVDYGPFRYISSDAPLFIHQFSHAWFDFRGKRDAYADYFQNSVLATRAHRQFCQNLRHRFPSYSADVWGITASDSCCGYVVWGGPPTQGPIDGTIVPAASAGSLPFVFDESMAVLQKLHGYYSDRIWKQYGFVDAFNPLSGWVSPHVLGIDVGISMLMAENARNQFVWNTFMRAPEVNAGMDKAGFQEIGQRLQNLA